MGSFQNSLCVVDLVFHRPSLLRAGDLGKIVTDADKGRLHLNKKIVSSDNYRKLVKIAQDAREWLRQRAYEQTDTGAAAEGGEQPSVMASWMKRGMALVRINAVEGIVAYLREREAEYMAAADEFVAEWPSLVAESPEVLRSQFDVSDYPSQDKIKRGFWVTISVYQITTPQGAPGLSEVFAEQERAKAEAAWEVARKEVAAALRQTTLEILNKLAAGLGDKADGTKAALHPKTYEAVKEFLGLFSSHKDVGDVELGKLVAKAKQVLEGKSLDDLQQLGQVRAIAALKTEAIVKDLTFLIEEQGREIVFE